MKLAVTIRFNGRAGRITTLDRHAERFAASTDMIRSAIEYLTMRLEQTSLIVQRYSFPLAGRVLGDVGQPEQAARSAVNSRFTKSSRNSFGNALGVKPILPAATSSPQAMSHLNLQQSPSNIVGLELSHFIPSCVNDLGGPHRSFGNGGEGFLWADAIDGGRIACIERANRLSGESENGEPWSTRVLTGSLSEADWGGRVEGRFP